MGKSGGTSTTTQTPQIPDELRPFISQTAGANQEFQKLVWEKMLPGVPFPGDDGAAAPPGGGAGDDFPIGTGPGFGGGPPPGTQPPGGPSVGINAQPITFGTQPIQTDSPVDSTSPTTPSDFSVTGEDFPISGGVPDRLNEPSETQTEAFVPGGFDPGGFEGGILGDLGRNIVGPSSLEQFAADQVRGLIDSPEQFGIAQDLLGQLGDVSRRRVSGGGLGSTAGTPGGVPISGAEATSSGQPDRLRDGASAASPVFNDPALQAAQEAFNSAMKPIIENQAALSGLGRSTALTNATAAEQGRTLLPLIQGSLAREERGIDRELGALGQQFSGFTGLGDRAQSRKGEAIAGGLEVGGLGRGLAQSAQDAARDEALRGSALFEQNLGGPLGLLPSTIGSTATSSQGKK